MKIDWSKWSFKISDDWAENVVTIHSDTGAQVYVGNLKQFKSIDNPSQAIKEKVKEHIRQYYVDEQIKQWKGQIIPVEDNLDYIENEAERRGL